MAETRRKTTSQHRTYKRDTYEDGNAVRRVRAEAAPDWEAERRKKKRPEEKKQVRKAPERKTYKKAADVAARSLSFDKRYFTLVMTAIVLVMISVVSMVAMQGKVEAQQINIASLQSELQDKQADNAAYEDALNNKYSLNDIYTIATNELGMVYSQQGQVIYYESANEDYVNQYDDVPESR